MSEFTEDPKFIAMSLRTDAFTLKEGIRNYTWCLETLYCNMISLADGLERGHQSVPLGFYQRFYDSFERFLRQVDVLATDAHHLVPRGEPR
ncbi:hypothetical protein ACFPM7_28065 [Actinokineospora guangxiensis]|uniref:Uncharacterized protein n=1 Tax=Actinokineospora guangxiensis TaxID=1490288 RepID=A0ABW0EX34_9PSEU